MEDIINELKKDINETLKTKQNFIKNNNKESAIAFENEINKIVNKAFGKNISFKVSNYNENKVTILPLYKGEEILTMQPIGLILMTENAVKYNTHDLRKMYWLYDDKEV